MTSTGGCISHPIPTAPPRHGAARVISKLGMASRTQAARWIREGRVRINGRIVRDPEYPVQQGRDRIEIAAAEADVPVHTGDAAARVFVPLCVADRVVVALNKPRGLLTTTQDEQGRATVYRCFAGSALPWLAPVGRLDKASEGLLLFCNDPLWAASLTDPASGPSKTYHVQIDRVPDAALLEQLARGVDTEVGFLDVESVTCLRRGARNAWLVVVLGEGRNRHIRRLLAAFDIHVLRLIRVAIGPLQLGDLPKGGWRILAQRELDDFGAVLQRVAGKPTA